MITYLPSGFIGRDKFPALLKKKKLQHHTIEIGTHRGYFADIFMNNWQGKKLFCVDPWANPEGYEEQAKYLSGNGKDREDDYKWAKKMAHRHAPRVELIRCLSTEATSQFKNNSIDFIYLDGDHREESVYLDLNLWFEKVIPGGIIAGHDIICGDPGYDDWGVGIRKAVGDFATTNSLNIYIVPEEANHNWSYYMVKE